MRDAGFERPSALWPLCLSAHGGPHADAARLNAPMSYLPPKQLKFSAYGGEPFGEWQRLSVAYAITVTNDGSYIDGAGVLGWSALRQHHAAASAGVARGRAPGAPGVTAAVAATPPRPAALVAFVAPKVSAQGRANLRAFGYRVLEVRERRRSPRQTGRQRPPRRRRHPAPACAAAAADGADSCPSEWGECAGIGSSRR